MDPEIYDDPKLFRPERFQEQPDLQDPKEMVFGFGRRVCPGKLFADANLWLAAVNITSAFDISKVIDQKGNEFTPTAIFTSGFVRYVRYLPIESRN